MVESIRPIAEAIRARGGRAIAVGGFVRDHLLRELGRLAGAAKDLDVEVFGLSAPELAAALRGFGEVIEYGSSFPVMRVVGREIDFALPRSERGPDPAIDFATAARRRDLTIHAIGLDPLTCEILDPLGGRADLAARGLRAADPGTFASDPLRGLRVMQIAARFAMEPDAELVALCVALDLSGLPGERLRVEFDKLLLRAERPSRGLDVLRKTNLLHFFPELAHPEGDTWDHWCLSLDAAALLRAGEPGPDDAALMYAVLCLDAGIEGARLFLEQLRAPNALVARVLALVEHHSAPEELRRDGAPPQAYRRLVRELDAAGVDAALLERVARANHLGSRTPEALAHRFPVGDRFIAAIAQLEIPVGGPTDAVWGRHLVARGLEPGPEFARILERCREVQDETGWSDPDAILRRALDESA